MYFIYESLKEKNKQVLIIKFLSIINKFLIHVLKHEELSVKILTQYEFNISFDFSKWMLD